MKNDSVKFIELKKERERLKKEIDKMIIEDIINSEELKQLARVENKMIFTLETIRNRNKEVKNKIREGMTRQ